MKLLENILSEVKNLPTLPTVYSTLSEAVDDPKTSANKLSKIISSDQTSAFKVLQVANSPFYGFRGRIDTISQAIIYLGFTEVKNIVFALSVINVFSKDKILQDLRPVDLWAHSIGVGIITRAIGHELGEKKLENFFLSGILHDIGKIVLLEFAHSEYSKVLDLVKTNNCLIKEAENEIFGFDHGKLGYIIAEKWKLPQSIQETILQHNMETFGSDDEVLIASVHVADIVARILELGYPGDNLIPKPNPAVWEILNLSNEFFPYIRSSVEEDYKQTIHTMLVG